MRENIFRGKREDNGEWIESQSVLRFVNGKVCIPKSHGESTYYENEAGNIVLVKAELYSVIPETVGQYIGLTDKYGKKIFEGDICRLTNRNKTIVFIVRYGMFKPTLLYAYAEECGQDLTNPIIGTYAESLTNKGEQMVLTDYSYQFMVVIGNVHDNPELLKGEADNG